MKCLYYEDVNLSEFTAKIIKQTPHEDDYYLILDQTAFYPDGGGMPADHGTLNGEEVISVFKEDGDIIHVVKNKIEETEVEGKVDLKLRYLHMQEHDAQHLISAILEKDYSACTVSHHIHTNYVDIVVDGPKLTEEQMKEVEEKANELIKKQTPIEKFNLTRKELADYNIKDNPVYEEPIRITNIKELNDYNPCTCLHYDNLAAIQAVKILGIEKQKNNHIIYFTAGQMLLNYLETLNNNMDQIKQELRANNDNIIFKFDILVNERNNLKNEISDLKDLYYVKVLDELADQSDTIIYHEPTNNMENIKKLSTLIMNYEKPLVAFLQIQKSDDSYQFVLVKQKDSDYDIGSLFNKLKEKYEIKGGGSKLSYNGQAKINLASVIKKEFS